MYNFLESIKYHFSPIFISEQNLTNIKNFFTLYEIHSIYAGKFFSLFPFCLHSIKVNKKENNDNKDW